MTTEQLLTSLMPVIIWAVTWLINKVTPYFGNANGLVILAIVVPLLSAVSVWLLGLIQPGTDWYLQFIYNFSAVFINELIKQLKKVRA